MTAPAWLGLDVGSMSVKAVLHVPALGGDVQRIYRPHRGCQAETVLELLTELEASYGICGSARVALTGSGAAELAPGLNATFVQEVSAVGAAVEYDDPQVRTAVDLGGQDAKILIWAENPHTGKTRRFTNMNDKCAGGTGATIDRIVRKLGIDSAALSRIEFDPQRVHPVASKCGIFAETDINSLLKQGRPLEDCIISLCNAIVTQNLGTLVRNRRLKPSVILLGGPHVYCPALVGAWKYQLARIWQADGLREPANEEWVRVPEGGLYFAARGAVIFTRQRDELSAKNILPSLQDCQRILSRPPKVELSDITVTGESAHAMNRFTREAKGVHSAPPPHAASAGDLFIGLDAGSTSTKGVIIDASGRLIAQAYHLTQGTPLDGAKQVLVALGQQVREVCSKPQVRALTVTGYAAEFLQAVIGADHRVVETVAHAAGAREFAGETDVILDVGGQDIKVLFLTEGVVTDFLLNTQCSAGNGYYLQNSAERFHVPVERYAEVAETARRAPPFKTGCAVFLESDIVTFQQQGWTQAEILLGLAEVLPKNIWEYVVQDSSLARRGTRFLLQGGTHKNLAVVRAQVNYITARVPDASVQVHPHAGEAGALGAAVLGLRNWQSDDNKTTSVFVGFDEIEQLDCQVRHDESTRCSQCTNRCMRTFITVTTTDGKVRETILAPCDKGVNDALAHVQPVGRNDLTGGHVYWNAVAQQQMTVFSAGLEANPDIARDSSSPRITTKIRTMFARVNRRRALKIGLPKVLNLWRYAPFFNAYLRTLTNGHAEIVWSSFTTEQLWSKASHLNCVDLCFPGKYAVAHVNDLLVSGCDMIINPAIVSLDVSSPANIGAAACPVAMANPDLVKAAFTTNEDTFQKHKTKYKSPVLHMDSPDLLAAELFSFAKETFGVSRSINKLAVNAGWHAYETFYRDLQEQSTRTLLQLIERNEVGIVFLGRPYHYEPGMHHGIPGELQKLGYPIFTIESLPRDPAILNALFGRDLADGFIADVFDVKDVWRHSLSENTNRKLWAAKVAARIPQLAIVDFLSFRCGPDATILHVIERIARCSGTPYFTFHDMDQNKPTGSLRIRLETIDYYLRQYQQKLRSHSPDPCTPSTAAAALTGHQAGIASAQENDIVPT